LGLIGIRALPAVNTAGLPRLGEKGTLVWARIGGCSRLIPALQSSRTDLSARGLVLIGIAIGIGSAFGLTRFLAAFLFGVNVRDPMAFTSIALALTLIALLAIWLPALRASRRDPIHALRYE
jgi:hypothetical protein